MTWTTTNLVIEIVAGIFGAHAISTLAKEHDLGAVAHTVIGALGGGLSGYFLQTRAAVIVDLAGEFHEPPDQVTQWFVQAIAGLTAGAVLTMGVALAKHAIDQHRRGQH